MLVQGEIDNVPLLDVLQVVSYSHQTGILTVEGSTGRGTVLFDRGAVVCGATQATQALLARAASETDRKTLLTLRRVQILAVLTELLAVTEGVFRFKNLPSPLGEVAGVPTRLFYEGGAFDLGELLLVLASAIQDQAPSPAPADTPYGTGRAHPRFSPTLIPAVLDLGSATLEGHLGNLSEGGAFFHGDVLPPAHSLCPLRFTLPGEPSERGVIEARVRVAWSRVEGGIGQRGAGLAFLEMREDCRRRIASYLEHYRRLADIYREADPENPPQLTEREKS